TVVLARLGELAAGLVDQVTRTGAAVAEAHLGLPGLVDVAAGRLLLAPNLGWRELRPAEHLGGDVLPAGVPLLIDNDANLSAYGVAMAAPGRAAESRTFAYLTGDIGIGAAVVADGRVLTGQHGWAGEIGHVVVEPDGPQCHCGARGCLERYAGKRAVLEAAGLPAGTSGEELAAEAASGYGMPRVAVERAAWALGVALADLVNIVDVGEVVLGEAFAPLMDLLRPGIEEQLRVRTLSRPWNVVRLRSSSAMRAPATTGGAFRALDSVIRDPAGWIVG
ncbi:ROK family protein, partial [Georgenia sp. 10Sc9-8]|nr:ROK family protein [Georgenia halotolerans]